MAIEDYSTTAALNTTINGVNVAELCPAPNLNNAIRELMADLATFSSGLGFAAGTVMLFVQSAAPTGWTKVTAHDNKALRVVNGTAGSGGTVDFTSAFASGSTTDSHVLTSAEMPAHQHFAFNGDSGSGTLGASNYATGFATGLSNNSYSIQGDATVPTIGLTSSTGGGGGHTHTLSGLNLAVKYVDTIIATKT